MFRKLFFLATGIAIHLSLFAQQPTLGMPEINNNKPVIVNGKIKGRIYDAKDKTILPYVYVVLLSINNDSVIAGNLVDDNGYLSLNNIPLGYYKLKATALGYDSIVKIIHLEFGNSELEIGNLYMNPSALLLKSVVISGKKSQIELRPDKKVINVEKDISAKGGTALDALKNAPGITINADDEITLRNSTPTIYVDGKPTNLTLRQIPADQINTIEIITNPSVKYEASATGGIINITLKKNNKPGYNGMLNAGIGTNNQYSGMGMFNIKEKKWGANFSYNYNSNITTASGFSNRDNFLNNLYNGGSYQDVSTTFNRRMQFARFGFDYFINNRNTISINQNLMFGKMGFTETQNTNQLNKEYNLVSSSIRNNLQDIHISNYATTISFKHSYPKQGKEYTADFTYNSNQGKNHYDYTTHNYSSIGTINLGNPELQLYDISNTGRIITTQFDFINPFSKTKRLELGFRANWVNTNSLQSVINYDYASESYLTDNLLSSKYHINEIIAAGYINYSGVIKKLNYQAGLRIESSNFFANYGDTNKYSYSYPASASNIGYALFPSLNLSYNLNTKHQLQFNASRKIARPNMFQSMPFVFASDKFNYRTGNPLLKPEFISLVEVNYYIHRNSWNLLTSFYGKYNEQPISPYSYYSDSTNQVLISTFANANHAYSYGIEPVFTFSKIKNLSLNISANVFYSLTGSIENKTKPNDSWSWNTKANISYRFPKQFTIQLNGSYEAPKPILQGRILSMYGADISLSKAIKDLTFTFLLSDISNSRKMQIEYDQPDYYQIQSRRRDTRFIRFTLSYRFGKMDGSIFKMKKNNGDMQQMNSNDGY
jgi:hypothetical protein